MEREDKAGVGYVDFIFYPVRSEDDCLILVAETLSPSTAKRDRSEKKDVYEKAGIEEYWIVSPQGSVEIYYLENGKYVLEQSYMLQDDKEDEYYNAETVIRLRAFPHIEMKLGDIFENVD